MFYGEVAGECTALYQVRIGDNKAESELGVYEVDGVKILMSAAQAPRSMKLSSKEKAYFRRQL